MTRETLQPYISMADMLARTFGKECEVVLYDMTNPQHSVVYAANNTVTNCQIGDRLPSSVSQMLRSPDLKEDFISNYYFHTEIHNKEHLIRSSAFLFRKPDGSPDGVLCINLDTEPITSMIEFLKGYLPEQPSGSASSEAAVPRVTEEKNVSSMVSSLIDHILEGISDEATRDERVERIRSMENKGVFLMKGSVEQVAAKMGVNKVTIYSYLDEVHGKRR